MSALAVLNAERIKVSTTRAPLWMAVTVAVLSLVLAAIQGMVAHSPVEPARAAIGVAAFGVPVLMVLASMTVTTEYRSGLIRTTFIATPNRAMVLAAKAVVMALFSAAFGAALAAGSVMVARLFATPASTGGLPVDSPEALRVTGAIALYATLAAALGVAVGALLRAGPGAVAVLLLWPLVAEPMLGNLPDVGPAVGPYLPFGNILVVTDVPWIYPVYAMPWGPVGSLVYFAAVVAAVFAAAVVVLSVRDA